MEKAKLFKQRLKSRGYNIPAIGYSSIVFLLDGESRALSFPPDLFKKLLWSMARVD